MTAPATLLAAIADRAAHDPDGTAFLFGGRATTYGELEAGVERCAAGLVREGLAPGEPVVLAVPNGSDFFSAFYGVERAGGVPVPTFPGSGLRRLAALARRCGARRVLVDEPDRLEADGADGPPEVLAVEQLLASPAAQLPSVGPDDLAYIQYTSGTTGEPKGVRLTHRAVRDNIRQLVAGFDITPEDVFVSWLPAYHDMGLVLMTMVPLALGARLVLLPASLRSLRPWLEAIETHRGTFTAAPDFGYRMALRVLRDRERPDLASLRVALNAAEPVRAATIEAFEDTFGLDSVMIAGYGLAEATVGVAAWPPGQPPLVDANGNVSVGRPFPDVEIAIRGEDRLLGSDELGEILVRSPAATVGYLGEPERTGELFWRGGYVRTGDLGYLDGDGHLFVAGRAKQMILQAGRNLAPREVEEIVDDLPFVRRSAAIGVDRGDDAGEQLYVVVELRQSARPIDEACRERIIAVVEAIHSQLGLRPGRVYLAAPKTIPLTPNGKVRYGELRDAYRAGSLHASGRLWFPPW